MGEKCGQCETESDFVYLHSKCHTNIPTWAKYYKNNRLVIECAECKEKIVEFIVVEIK